MTQTAEKPKPPRFIPKLSREGVGDWKGGTRTKSFGFTDFGNFVLALKRMQCQTNEEKQTTNWIAECKIISCSPVAGPSIPSNEKKLAKLKNRKLFEETMTPARFVEVIEACRKQAVEGKYAACWTDPTTKFPVGSTASLFFPVNRPGTTAQPNLPDIDDRYLVSFLRALIGIPAGQPYDFPTALARLDDLGAFEADTELFRYEAVPNAYPFELVDNGEVLRSTCRVGIYRDFSSVSA